MDVKVECKQLCLFDVSEFRFDEWHHNDPDLTLPPADAVALKEVIETLQHEPEADGTPIAEC